MTREERKLKLESFGRGPASLMAALRMFPKKMWLYKITPDRWSIHEIIFHLADSEATSYIRCRRLIAEPGSSVLAYDPAIWASSLGYFHQSIKEAVDVTRLLRRMTYQLLRAVPEVVWLHTVEHPKLGRLSLERWLEIQERHIPHHLQQMGENYAAWLKLNPPRKAPTSAQIGGPTRRVLAMTSQLNDLATR